MRPLMVHGPRFRSLIWRILAPNVLALVILLGGLLYLGQYKRGLVESELDSLQVQGEIIAAALGEAAVTSSPLEGQDFLSGLARPMVRRLARPANLRARLFAANGELIADSRALSGPGGQVRIEELPPPQDKGGIGGIVIDSFAWVLGLLPESGGYPPYRETAVQQALDYGEAAKALNGEIGKAVRSVPGGHLVLSVAVPVQRYKHVLGVLMLSAGSAGIEASLREVRLNILNVFAIVLVITVSLTIFLARTIIRPVQRLAAAAKGVRPGQGRKVMIPDFAKRRDEIGDLSVALRDMTDALWQRIDAIESFAADVAHEIKNPLTSLRSAVETAARIEDPDQQRKLMAIILDDVQRLDRLITDISNASRLDAELSRAENAPVDIAKILAALAEVHGATGADGGLRLELELTHGASLMVSGIEDRLVQVYRNLVSNASSFTPAGGTVTLRGWRQSKASGDAVIVTVEDQGPGLPEDKRDAIFDRFYSERPKDEKFGLHSGLGLSISKQIVEAHRGLIAAENIRRDGHIAGARFTVSLPALDAAAGQGRA
ncbi:MAG: stimulus-sensing domain-containing protein [Alphaproteobacteria bacterium]